MGRQRVSTKIAGRFGTACLRTIHHCVRSRHLHSEHTGVVFDSKSLCDVSALIQITPPGRRQDSDGCRCRRRRLSRASLCPPCEGGSEKEPLEVRGGGEMTAPRHVYRQHGQSAIRRLCRSENQVFTKPDVRGKPKTFGRPARILPEEGASDLC